MIRVLECLKEINWSDGVSVFVMFVFVCVWIKEYIIPLNAPNIERLLRNEQEDKKAEKAAFVIVYIYFVILNGVIVLVNIFWGVILIIVLFLTILMIVSLIVKKLKQIKWGIHLIFILSTLTFILILLSHLNEINKYVLIFVISLFQVFMLDYFVTKQMPYKALGIIQEKSTESAWYVYKRINDDYFLCGDSHIVTQTKKVFFLSVKDIYENKYEIEVITKH